MGVVRRFLPLSRTALALWAWRNRHHIDQWGRFGVRAGCQLATGSRVDTLTEAKLRVALTTDARTRGAPGLQVRVEDGVAVLGGWARPDAAEAAVEVAERTSGVVRIRNEIRVTAPRRRSSR